MLAVVQSCPLLLLQCIYKAIFHIQLITAYICYISEFTNQLVRFTVNIIRTDLLQGFIFAGILDYNPADAHPCISDWKLYVFQNIIICLRKLQLSVLINDSLCDDDIRQIGGNCHFPVILGKGSLDILVAQSVKAAHFRQLILFDCSGIRRTVQLLDSQITQTQRHRVPGIDLCELLLCILL